MLPVGLAPGALPLGPEGPVAAKDTDPLPTDSASQVSLRPGSDTGGQAAPVSPQGPRVRLVSQFDGGPMQNANCTLAAGAMLAQAAFGIHTTGTTLRGFQFDQVGGTDLVDLQTALLRGFGVTIVWNTVRSDELRALLSFGAGVVVQGDYSRIPVEWRLQGSFEGGHAIYIDAYYPGDAATPPAYFVIDPLGRGEYVGAWWHVSVVDDFAASFAGPGSVSAAWAPIGGSG